MSLDKDRDDSMEFDDEEEEKFSPDDN